MRRHRGSKVIAAIATLIVCGVTAAAANASTRLYWAGYGYNTIGAANLNGSDADATFVTGGDTPCGDIAVSKEYVYWSNYDDNSIGRATVNGTDVNQDFIPDADGPCGVAVYAGRLYWTNYADATIGEATINGGDVNESFIGTTDEPCGITVSAKRIYWENYASPETIGRADLNGSGVKNSFIAGAGSPCYGVAVNRHYIYWSNYDAAVARADINGTHVNLDFVPGDDYTCGIAISSNYLYWGNYEAGTIGRSKLNGTDVNQSFISHAPENCGLAVGPPTTAATLSRSKNPTTVGKHVSYTATINPIPDGGTVRFTSNGKTIHGCKAVKVSLTTGKASCRVTYHAAGKQTVKASYTGDSDFYGSKSAAVKETVKR